MAIIEKLYISNNRYRNRLYDWEAHFPQKKYIHIGINVFGIPSISPLIIEIGILLFGDIFQYLNKLLDRITNIFNTFYKSQNVGNQGGNP